MALVNAPYSLKSSEIEVPPNKHNVELEPVIDSEESHIQKAKEPPQNKNNFFYKHLSEVAYVGPIVGKLRDEKTGLGKLLSDTRETGSFAVNGAGDRNAFNHKGFDWEAFKATEKEFGNKLAGIFGELYYSDEYLKSPKLTDNCAQRLTACMSNASADAASRPLEKTGFERLIESGIKKWKKRSGDADKFFDKLCKSKDLNLLGSITPDELIRLKIYVDIAKVKNNLLSRNEKGICFIETANHYDTFFSQCMRWVENNRRAR